MRGVQRPEIERRVAATLDLVRLPGLGDRKPGQLSGGQQQRVALARALINEPAVLLLDEPLGALDLKLREEMQLELKALQRRLGITFIYVTHDQEEALTMSDRVAVMNAGRILQVGPPTQVYERPGSRFVADFIGEANLVDGLVAGVGDGVAEVTVAAGTLTVAGLAPDPVRVGDAVTVAVRPEKLRLSAERPDGVANRFEARVEQVTYHGADTRLVVRLAPELALVVRDANEVSRLDPGGAQRLGEPVWVSWPVENALVLGD
jgi:spermidine/putrescine transport system ATP-binding protein